VSLQLVRLPAQSHPALEKRNNTKEGQLQLAKWSLCVIDMIKDAEDLHRKTSTYCQILGEKNKWSNITIKKFKAA
jgi:uncharacterized protein Veg